MAKNNKIKFNALDRGETDLYLKYMKNGNALDLYGVLARNEDKLLSEKNNEPSTLFRIRASTYPVLSIRLSLELKDGLVTIIFNANWW